MSHWKEPSQRVLLVNFLLVYSCELLQIYQESSIIILAQGLGHLKCHEEATWKRELFGDWLSVDSVEHWRDAKV
jgi:hypothetical protein